jgi:hypothetical protein
VPAADLAKEAQYLHLAFFRCDPPPEVTARYIAANELCCPEPDEVTGRMVALGLDVEAVELALRVRRGPTILTKKIRILFYLLEVRSAYYSYFVGDDESLPRAGLGLFSSVVQTALKYLKGAYLIRRHGLI